MNLQWLLNNEFTNGCCNALNKYQNNMLITIDIAGSLHFVIIICYNEYSPLSTRA